MGWLGRIRNAWNAMGQRPSPLLDPVTSLLAREGFAPADFHQGLEVFNDATTPVEFVIEAFERHLGYAWRKAANATLAVHDRGGALLPTATWEEAVQVANAITADARAQGFPLVCRAVQREAG